MGADNSVQHWKQDYELVPKPTIDPSRSTIRHKRNHQHFDLTTLYLNNGEQAKEFMSRLRKRQSFRSPFILPFQRVCHNEDSNLCGNNQKYELISPEVKSTLGDHLAYRQSTNQQFLPEQISYVIHRCCHGLKDLKAMQDEHGHINLRSIVVSQDIFLEDPIIANRNQHETENYSNKGVEGYPSPAILLHQVDSGLRIQKFKEDLYSVGLIALQMYNPNHNIKKSIYLTTNKKHENTRLNQQQLNNYLQQLKPPALQQQVSILLHPNSEERLRIYPILLHSQPQIEQIPILKQNTKSLNKHTTTQTITSPEQKDTSTTQNRSKQQIQHVDYPKPHLVFSNSQIHALVGSQTSLNNLNQSTKFSFRNPPSSLQQSQNTNLYQSEHKNINRPSQQLQSMTPTFSKHSNLVEPRQEIIHQHMQPPYFQSQYALNQLQPQRQGITQAPREQIQSQVYSMNSFPDFVKLPEDKPIPTSTYQPSTKYEYPLSSNEPLVIANPSSELRESSPLEAHEPNKEHKQEEPQSGEDTIVNRRWREKQEIEQKLKQLEDLNRRNRELEEMIAQGSTNLFKKQLDIPHSEIREVTEEDSRNEDEEAREEPNFVIEEYEDGTRYEGFLKNGVRNGYGKFYYKSGSIYDGEWSNNQMHGYGTLYYPEGSIAYEGNWQNDEFQGTGIVNNDNPQPIRGLFDFKNFQFLESDQWACYDGENKNSKREGKGKLILSNGETFEGEFHNDLPHGTGMFTTSGGSKVKGIWSNGVLTQIFS